MSTTCDHCGTAFVPVRDEDRYCCKGCECVAAMIRDSGNERFYDLRGNSRLDPVKGRPFENHDFGWLDAGIIKAEEDPKAGVATLDCSLEGLSCVACVWLVERLFEQHPGAVRAVSNPARGSLHLEWKPGECDVPAFAKELVSFGYTPAPATSSVRHDDHGLATRTGLCFAFALNAMGFSLPTYLGMSEDFEFASLFGLITFLSATLSMLVGGSWFIVRAWRALRLREIHIDLPISLGLVAAYAGSIVGWMSSVSGLLYFDFVCTFVFLMLGGRWLQTLAVEKNRRRIARRSPVPESVRRDGVMVAVADLRVGDGFEVEAGRAVPVASILQSDEAEFSLEWIRGESDAVAFRSGANLPAGAIVIGRSGVRVRALETWNESLLARLTAEVEPDRGSPALQRLLRIYLVVVILTGLGGFAWWLPVAGFGVALQVMISVFVVSCPCALGVAIPFADERASRLAAQLGAFVRNGALWGRLGKVRQIVFDKTGTLTLERPVLESRDQLAGLDDESAGALARLTAGSCHPVARSLIEGLGPRGQQLLSMHRADAPTETPGMGVSVEIDGDEWSLGRAGWRAEAESGTTVLSRSGIAVASFAFRDALRPDARSIRQWLSSRGFGLHILSGDHPAKVSELAAELGMDPDCAHGGLSPDEKAAWMEKIDRDDTLYLGDGANDSLAFDRAYVTGTPVADRSLLEKKADFFSLGDGLGWLPGLFEVARARSAGIRRAFGFTLIYNLAAVGFCLAGHMSPLLAAILMPISSVISITLAGTARVAAEGRSGKTSSAKNEACPNLPTLPDASTSAC
ncbi:copper-translocating P-type ATPase [Haloferula helveola]|uniref:Copper-translocating P-type ATPase n=1 Tax=Haloferula helveola TaxID=490095 RepID=A0ABM7REI1_9BACT|nr:copper-translocating P-type ATPase [Haloferula helveola]